MKRIYFASILWFVSSALASSREEYVSQAAASSSAYDQDLLAKTARVLADAKAIAVSSNARPHLTEDAVRRLLAKRTQKLRKITDLNEKVDVIKALQKTVRELLYKNMQEVEKASRNSIYQEDELKKMRAAYKKLINENVILLDLDDDELRPSGSQDQLSGVDDDDVLSQISVESMSSDEAKVRDNREVAKIIEPQSVSKKKIVEGFKAHIAELEDAQEKLSEKLAKAEEDLANAQAELKETLNLLAEINTIVLNLHASHPDALDPAVAQAVQRGQVDLARELAALDHESGGQAGASKAFSSCTLL